MTTKVDEIIEQLKCLTLLEATELVTKIESTFNIKASTLSEVANIATLSAKSLVQEPEEKTEFDLILEEVPTDKKVAILKVIRTLTGLGLKEAKDLVDSTPKHVKQGVSKSIVEVGKKQLEEAGAKVKIV